MSRLSKIIDVTVFQDLPPEDAPEKTAFFQSGAVVRNPLMDSLANSPGKGAELPFWGDLNSATEPNYSNDDPVDTATPLEIQQDEQKTRKAFLNQGWREADLAAELAMGGNAMRRIRARVDTYWTRRWQRRVVATATGVMLNNAGSNAGDMVHDISINNSGAPSSSNLVSRSAVISAAFTLGDKWDGVTAMVAHSVVMQQLLENDDIVYIPDSQGALTIPTYLGRTVLVDDGVPVFTAGTSGNKYVTMLFGSGVFAYGEGTPQVPIEVERDGAAGNGGGIEVLWTRKTWLIHPLGHSFTSTTVTGPSGKSTNNISPTDANLALAANWTRVYDRKNIPLAFLVTNG